MEHREEDAKDYQQEAADGEDDERGRGCQGPPSRLWARLTGMSKAIPVCSTIATKNPHGSIGTLLVEVGSIAEAVVRIRAAKRGKCRCKDVLAEPARVHGSMDGGL